MSHRIHRHCRCLEPHVLVVSKLRAVRKQGRDFATELVRGGLVDLETLGARTEMLSSATGLQLGP